MGWKEKAKKRQELIDHKEEALQAQIRVMDGYREENRKLKAKIKKQQSLIDRLKNYAPHIGSSQVRKAFLKLFEQKK